MELWGNLSSGKLHSTAKIQAVQKAVREVVKTIILARDPPKLIETIVSYGSSPPLS